jgi:hypothetical protein
MTLSLPSFTACICAAMISGAAIGAMARLREAPPVPAKAPTPAFRLHRSELEQPSPIWAVPASRTIII